MITVFNGVSSHIALMQVSAVGWPAAVGVIVGTFVVARGRGPRRGQGASRGRRRH